MKGISIKTMLLLVTSVMIFMVVLGLVLNSYINQKKTLESALDREVKANGEILTVILGPLLDFNQKEKVRNILEQMIAKSKNINGAVIYKQEMKEKWINIIPENEKGFFQFSIKTGKRMIGSLYIYYTESEIRKEINSILFSNIIIGCLIFLFSILIISLVFGKIKKRLELLIDISNKIAKGDLATSKDILIKTFKDQNEKKGFADLDDDILFKKMNLGKQLGGRDELNRVLVEFYSMVKNLSLLVSRIKRTEDSVSVSAEEIASGARDIEASSIQQSASTHEISVTNEEVGSTSRELYSNIEKIGSEIKQTASLANSGKNGLLKMEDAMNQLIQSTRSISSKLAVINSKTNKISGVSTTINAISDQTNLLSINAAIEAEKAGDYGKGFLVIAKEINHLANQTTVATQEIENMVSEMQSSVLSGVMEMDKFSGEVKKRVEEVEGIGENLTEIIDQVQGLEPEFEIIRDGMTVQSDGTTQISESMSQLAESTKQTKNSIIEFKSVTDVLKKTVSRLKDEILRFRI